MFCNYFFDYYKSPIYTVHTNNLLSEGLPFFLNDCGHLYTGDKYYTERKGLDNYLIIYTLSGCGIIKYREKTYKVEKNQAFLIYCFDYQHYRTSGNNTWELRYIHFNGNACPYYFNIINGDSFNIVNLKDISHINRYFDEITGLSTDNDVLADFKISMIMTGILTDLVINRNNPINTNNVYNYNHLNAIIKNSIAFLEENYAEDIKIDDISNRLNISKYYVIRLFKKYLGITPYEYLLKIRINKAKNLLINSDFSISEISYKIGFNNVNNFIRCFKIFTKTTPHRFKTQLMFVVKKPE